MAHPADIAQASERHVEWCRALAARMGVATTHQSAPQMRAVMHELRRSLAPDETLKVANVLPALERGIFLEGWSLDQAPVPIPDAKDFAARVYDRVKAHHFLVPTLVSDVFWLWQTKLPEKDAKTIRKCLPPALATLWDDAAP